MVFTKRDEAIYHPHGGHLLRVSSVLKTLSKSTYFKKCNLKFTGGIAVLLWPKDVEVWVWPHGMAFYTPLEVMMPRPRLLHLG